MSIRPEPTTVAITGGARGIGRATAEACLRAGMSVATGDVDAAMAESVAAELDGNVVGLPVDVRDPDSFEAFPARTEAHLGPLDVPVNNAGEPGVVGRADCPARRRDLRRHQARRGRLHPSDSRRNQRYRGPDHPSDARPDSIADEPGGRVSPPSSRRACRAVERAERQRRVFPRARIEILPGVGHWAWLELPDRVAGLVVPFLRERGGTNV